jgi:tripartite ATP-independent transporter DctP family solute receptor
MSRKSLLGGGLLALLATTAVADEFRVGSGFGDGHVATRAIRDVFAPKVAELTEGRHSVSVFANSELGPAPEMINQAQSGINFGVYVSSAIYNSQVPDIGVTNLPFVFSDRETAFAVFDGPIGDRLKAEFAEKGLVVLGFMELGFRHITNSSHPIVAPADLAGMKIRLQSNPIHIATFATLGATGVTIDGGEMFAALSQGVVDGQENPYSVINTFRLYDAGQKYLTDTGHFFDVIVFAVSKSVFDGLTPEDQAAVLEAGRLATLSQRAEAAVDDGANLEVLVGHGVEVTRLTPEQREAFRLATVPVIDEVRGRLGADWVDSFLAATGAGG